MAVFAGSISNGEPHLGVGGGAYSRSFRGRVVATPDGTLPAASFIRSYGELACSEEQAFVPVRIGDYILSVSGPLPASPGNRDLEVGVWVVVGFGAAEAKVVSVIVEPASYVPAWWADAFPWDVLGVYHNRNGRPFTAGDVR